MGSSFISSYIKFGELSRRESRVESGTMIINERHDIGVYHGDPGTIVADPRSVLNLFDQDVTSHMQVIEILTTIDK